jgi:CRISPR type III-A-associated RAMP protein Csm4
MSVSPGLVVKLRPTGPWRIGPDSGARDGTDPIYHSDTLYSAVTGAMRLLGLLDDWLDATARNAAGAAVRFSSLYPFHNEIGFVVPPRSIWPPPASSKVRWKGARFIPLGLVAPILAGRLLEEDRWGVDGPSQCLVPAGQAGPFRVILRTGAAVDRFNGNLEPHSTSCIQFAPGAGLWAVISFSSEEQNQSWNEPVRAAFRLLADSGFGGKRSLGYGRSETPEFIEGTLPEMILPTAPAESPAATPPAAPLALGPGTAGPGTNGPDTAEPLIVEPLAAEPLTAGPQTARLLTAERGTAELREDPGAETTQPAEIAPAETPAPSPSAWWLLSLFTPAAGDSVDWKRGNYALTARGGRIESPARSGDLKKIVNMVSEGSVVLAANSVKGTATDVAPDGFAHPVYRAGFAFAIPVPWQAGS